MPESRTFYVTLFGFEVGMEMDWVVTLVSPSNRTAQVTLVLGEPMIRLDQNISISIDVSDVDAVYERAVAAEYEIVYDLTNEHWGVRRFHVRDPKTQFATSIWTIVPGTEEGIVSPEFIGLVCQLVLLAIGVVLVELYIRRYPESSKVVDDHFAT